MQDKRVVGLKTDLTADNLPFDVAISFIDLRVQKIVINSLSVSLADERWIIYLIALPASCFWLNGRDLLANGKALNTRIRRQCSCFKF